MLASLYEKNSIFNFALKPVERARWRTRNYSAILRKDTIMARTIETLLVRDPPYAATQMGTYVRHRNEILPILGQHISRKFLFSVNPTGLRLDYCFEKSWIS